ncbi:hypothetical protein KM043_016366 [Ampulex compressa]|nr:hypothetical protein KM043_016366 [Ampulex compressa]
MRAQDEFLGRSQDQFTGVETGIMILAFARSSSPSSLTLRLACASSDRYSLSHCHSAGLLASIIDAVADFLIDVQLSVVSNTVLHLAGTLASLTETRIFEGIECRAALEQSPFGHRNEVVDE